LRGQLRSATPRLLVLVGHVDRLDLLIPQEVVQMKKGFDELGAPGVLDTQRTPENPPCRDENAEALLDLDAKLAQMEVEGILAGGQVLAWVRCEQLVT